MNIWGGFDYHGEKDKFKLLVNAMKNGETEIQWSRLHCARLLVGANLLFKPLEQQLTRANVGATFEPRDGFFFGVQHVTTSSKAL
jgi:FKBP-type peptidyl-prolyl cis-trans isomerase 2